MNITRGDDKRFKFARYDDKKNIIEEIADEIFFSVKYNNLDDEVLIQKKLSDNTIEFSSEDYFYRFWIDSQDTDELSYGCYKYDIERIVDGRKKTISKGTFTIEEETTFLGNEG